MVEGHAENSITPCNISKLSCVWERARFQVAQWLSERLRDMKCTVHDLKVMSSKPGWVELGVQSPVHGTSVKVIFELRIHCFISYIRYQFSVGASSHILQDKLSEITHCNCLAKTHKGEEVGQDWQYLSKDQLHQCCRMPLLICIEAAQVARGIIRTIL